MRAEHSIMTAGLLKMVITITFIYLSLQLLYASAFESPNRPWYECPSKYTNMGSNQNSLCLRYLCEFLTGKHFRGNVSTKNFKMFKTPLIFVKEYLKLKPHTIMQKPYVKRHLDH